VIGHRCNPESRISFPAPSDFSDNRAHPVPRPGTFPTAFRPGLSPSYFHSVVGLSYRPGHRPAILDRHQPRELTAENLIEHSRLPLAWHDQRTALGQPELDANSKTTAN
jgi:hypothetical protein